MRLMRNDRRLIGKNTPRFDIAETQLDSVRIPHRGVRAAPRLRNRGDGLVRALFLNVPEFLATRVYSFETIRLSYSIEPSH
jgi:hypothetical protein